MANLTQVEKDQLKAAHDKAIAQDPTLDQKMKAAHDAMDAARQAMHDALLKADPTIGPILDKMGPKKGGGEPRPEGRRRDWGTNAPSTNAATGPSPMMRHGMPPGFANLTPDEQAQLKAAHEKVKDDPTVVAAREAAKNATTPEARRAAREAVRQAMHDAILKADPSLAPLLEKLAPPAPPANGGGSVPPPQ